MGREREEREKVKGREKSYEEREGRKVGKIWKR